jgi:hypothetical protein
MLRGDSSLDESTPIQTFRGGIRHGRSGIVNISHPLVTLAIYASGVELRSTFGWLPIFPSWRARYEDLSVIEAVGRPDADGTDNALAPNQARGIRFVGKVGGYMIFWCFNRDEVLAALAAHPVRIDYEARRFQWLRPHG